MKQQGFTLIELIIVIVILGILAVTAAPRFIDIQSDARKETIQGVKAALQGASQLVYAKSAIAGTDNAIDSSVTVAQNNGTVDTVYGYPDADSFTTLASLSSIMDVDASQLAFEDTADDGFFRVRFSSITSNDTDGTGCFVQYTNSTGAGLSPVISVTDNAC